MPTLPRAWHRVDDRAEGLLGVPAAQLLDALVFAAPHGAICAVEELWGSG